MSWIHIAVAGWLLGSAALALLIGMGIRAADRLARMGTDLSDACAELPPAEGPALRDGGPRDRLWTSPGPDPSVVRYCLPPMRRRATRRSANRH